MKTLSHLLLIVVLALVSVSAAAQDKPRWAIKGVNDLNKERTNETYSFVKFETFNGDLAQLRNESTKPLVEYLAGTYGLSDDDASVEVLSSPATLERSLPNDPEATKGITRDYKVTFSGAKPATFYARLVDEYVSFDDNVDESYDYTLYQLFEVSNREDGLVPDFDDCDFTRSYNAQALVRSIIPGLGQYYKGQTTKAYCIWGGEAVCAVAAIWCEHRRSQYAKDRDKAIADNPNNPDATYIHSYRSKSRSWRTFRNIAIYSAAGLYIYNLLDAAISKGPRQVIVRKKQASDFSMAVAPTLVYDPNTTISPAIGVSLTF